MTNDVIARQTASMATQANREDWKEHGFSHTGVMIHEKDKALLRAQADLMRVERLMQLVEDGNAAATQFVALRNMQKSPNAGEIATVEALTDKLPHEAQRKKVRAAMHGMRTYLRKYGEAITHEQANPTSYRCAALRVVYGNMVAKLFGYARALATHDSRAEPENDNAQ